MLKSDNGWQTVAGNGEWKDGKLILMPGTELKRSAGLKPGVYELQVFGSGAGTVLLSVGGQKRTLRLTEEPGLYGLLFEVTGADDAGFRFAYIGRGGQQCTLDWTAVVPADSRQLAAWAAAKKSFELLGYYGSDPQRPAPGSAKSSATSPAFTEADLKRWAIRDTIVFYDAGYDSHWVDDDAAVAAFFTRRGLGARTAVETEAWLKARSAGDAGVGTSIIFAMGTAPANIVYPPFADCLLAKYLQAGGRVVWMANVPMAVAQGPTGPKYSYDSPAGQMLGLVTDKQSFYGLAGATLTAAGKAWGLEPGLSLTRPAQTRSVTIPFVTNPGGDYCGVGLVNLRADVPFSGFIFVPDRANPTNEVLLRNVYRLARSTGKPVEIPLAIPWPESKLPLVASLRFGAADQRSVYLRGETVPLVLRLRALRPELGKVTAHCTLREDDAVLRDNTSTVLVGEKEADQGAGALDLSGLRVGRYTVAADLECGGKVLSLVRELRIAPQPDHRGTHIAIWCEASPKLNRTEDLLKDLAVHNLDPTFVDDQPLGRDMALWYGFSFSTRRHGQAHDVLNPPGYSDDRLGGTGQVMRVRSHGDNRDAKGYASPQRRQAEADDFQRQVAMDNVFPAFRKRTVTADDYSQWFGLDYNRYAVQGVRARYGFEPPRPKGTEDPYGTVNIDRAPGIIPDDDPWILLCRYWSETLGDAGRRFSRAMEAATDGAGKVGPVPGGMITPVIAMWSGQYPPFNFGAQNGFNLSCFYYYNSYWQPPLVHAWWLETARMGNRDIEQWMMPDCYMVHLGSYYHNNFWLMMAGGARGLPYFRYQERKPEAMEALKEFGAKSRRYGLMLEQLRPDRKQVAMLVPFENVTYRIEHGYEMAYPFMNLLLAKVDVEPVSPEELDAASIRNYEAVVVAQTKWLKAGTVRLLEDYIASGGKVVLDSVSAAAIPVKGAIKLDSPLGQTSTDGYGQADSIARVREALRPICVPPVDCDSPFVSIRRAALPDSTPGAWLVHNYTQAEYAKLRAGKDADPAAAKALETQLGFRRETISTTLTRKDDGRIPFDVFGGRILESTRSNGLMTVNVGIPKWEGMLIVFLSALPAQLEWGSVPSETKPGAPVRVSVKVRDAAGALVTTPLPLCLTVRDPRGNESRDYARRLLTDRGSAAYSFAFAANDKRGEWTLEIEELLTKIKTTRKVRVPQ